MPALWGSLLPLNDLHADVRTMRSDCSFETRKSETAKSALSWARAGFGQAVLLGSDLLRFEYGKNVSRKRCTEA